MRGRRKSYAYFFILPGCLILLMFTILAAALAFGFSFMDFNLLRPKDAAFVGFENYIRLFQDASFLKAMKNTLYFAVVVVPYQVTLAFGLALLVRENIKGIGIFRSATVSNIHECYRYPVDLYLQSKSNTGPFKCYFNKIRPSGLRFPAKC